MVSLKTLYLHKRAFGIHQIGSVAHSGKAIANCCPGYARKTDDIQLLKYFYWHHSRFHKNRSCNQFVIVLCVIINHSSQPTSCRYTVAIGSYYQFSPCIFYTQRNSLLFIGHILPGFSQVVLQIEYSQIFFCDFFGKTYGGVCAVVIYHNYFK